MSESIGTETLKALIWRYECHYAISVKEAGQYIRKDLREAIEELKQKGRK